MKLVMNLFITSCYNKINMKYDKKYFSTFMAFLFFILIASYLSYQIEKDAASRDARIKAAKSEISRHR